MAYWVTAISLHKRNHRIVMMAIRDEWTVAVAWFVWNLICTTDLELRRRPQVGVGQMWTKVDNWREGVKTTHIWMASYCVQCWFLPLRSARTSDKLLCRTRYVSCHYKLRHLAGILFLSPFVCLSFCLLPEWLKLFSVDFPEVWEMEDYGAEKTSLNFGFDLEHIPNTMDFINSAVSFPGLASFLKF